MANHARGNGSVGDKRSALANAQRNAYVHSDQVGGTRRRTADGSWVDREQEPSSQRPRATQPPTMGEFVTQNAKYILSAAAVVLVVVFVIFGVRACSAPTGGTPGAEGYVSPYDWSKLVRNGDRYAYVVDGKVKSKLGVDVAEYNYDIDWNAVAQDGIDFAIIRLGYRGATEGVLHLDDYYEANIRGAKAAGLDCGVYFFSQAISVEEAREEADFVLANLGGMHLEYPIAFDSEPVAGVGGSRTANLTDEQITAISDAFCDRIEAAGYRTIVYGNQYDLDSYGAGVLEGRIVWWAEYDVDYPSHDLDIAIWQYTANGVVNGIDQGGIDMNLDLSGVLL